MVWRVGHRLRLLYREYAKTGEVAAAEIGAVESVATPQPGKENPTFSQEAFLQIERHRVVICHSTDEQNKGFFERFEHTLLQFDKWLGDKLVVVLIPDEFQVNDALWQELMDVVEDPAAFARDLPQERIGRFCKQAGIKLIDALPALRAAEPGGNTFHLRDTHVNARGNRVLGELLGRELAILATRKE